MRSSIAPRTASGSKPVIVQLLTVSLLALALAGCKTLDGGGMAVFQAARAFEIFTGLAADGERMRRHFMRVAGN